MKLVTVLLLAVGVGLVPWQSSEPVDAAMNARIRQEGLERSQVARHFSMFVDTIGPRLTASPAHRRAAEWAREQLQGWGLSNARLESFEFGRGWTLDKQTIEMVEPRFMPLIGYAEAWSPSTKGEVLVSAVSLAGRSVADLPGSRPRSTARRCCCSLP